jgi:hypothetical protein
VMFLSNGMMPFSGVRRTMEIRFLHTGKRIRAMSTCRTNAADRAIGNVNPNVSLAPTDLSCARC